MKLLRTSVFLFLVATASSVWAQLGLYGSPEPLQLPAVQPAATPYGGQAVSYGQAPVGPVMGPPQPGLVQPPMVPRVPAVPEASLTPVPLEAPGAYGPQPGMPVPGPSVVGPMANDPAACGVGAGGAGYADCNGGNVAGACEGVCAPAPVCYPWYVSMTSLIMTRDRANKLWTTYEAGNEPHQIPTFPDYDWQFGGEMTVGHRLGGGGDCCGCSPWAIEATYWGLTPFEVCTAPADAAAAYSTPFSVRDLSFATGNPDDSSADNWYDWSPNHRVWRTDEFHNLELNLVRNQVLGGECSPWSVDWLLGIRYFYFRDHLVFGAEHGALDDAGNPSDFAGQWAYLDDEVRNNLLGLQMGFSGEYRLGCHLRLFAASKFGIYDNMLDLDYSVYTADGLTATQTAYPDRQYPVHSSHNGFSFLTQLDAGVKWQITPHWEANVGYRVIAVTGAALAENQVPHFGVDTEAIADIDRNGSLILHGAFAGATFAF